MPVNKKCDCKEWTKCKHGWRLDVMHEGRRWRMPLNDFALARGAERPVTSKQEAEKTWEPKFLAEIVAGKDPRVPPNRPTTKGTTVSQFLDLYEAGWVDAEKLKSQASVKSRLRMLKAGLGELPVEALNRNRTYPGLQGEAAQDPVTGDGEPCPGRPAPRHQLGPVPDATDPDHQSVPQIRGDDQDQR